MNELQTCVFDIFREVAFVCDKLKIRYYMVCGSALGAIKYKGFIPWDDDIDIGMFREDYERFLREAPRYLPKHLFLQNFHTDKGFSQIFSKVRDSRTTYIEKSAAHINMHHGVYIDIFPLDGYPKDQREIKNLERKKKIYKFLAESRFKFNRSYKAEMCTKFVRLFVRGKMIDRILVKYERLISSYDTSNSDLICNHGNWQGVLEYSNKEQYGDGYIAEFEGISVRVPERYDEYLTQKYGDWRSELHVNDQVGHHYYCKMDLEKSYTMYMKNK